VNTRNKDWSASLLGEAWPGVVATSQTWLSTWGSVVGYCALIFVLSSQPDLSLPGAFPSSDKLAHLLEYGVLGWLWARAMRVNRPGLKTLTVLLSALVFTGTYGLSDEWHQLYVPGRFADLRDVLADAFGGTCGGVSYLLWLQRKDGEEEKSHRREAGTIPNPNPCDPAP
jgi:VanZ family protein